MPADLPSAATQEESPEEELALDGVWGELDTALRTRLSGATYAAVGAPVLRTAASVTALPSGCRTLTLALPSAFAFEKWHRPPIKEALAEAAAALAIEARTVVPLRFFASRLRRNAPTTGVRAGAPEAGADGDADGVGDWTRWVPSRRTLLSGRSPASGRGRDTRRARAGTLADGYDAAVLPAPRRAAGPSCVGRASAWSGRRVRRRRTAEWLGVSSHIATFHYGAPPAGNRRS